ncbi:hypothetical protein Lepto7375DRAFT_7980 [Leptolyngbya sp. PCC 7375]|nr:hypothetical protein Lepto7375DRAFT_7980 [Leptolyngbya sp. PCC 7375]
MGTDIPVFVEYRKMPSKKELQTILQDRYGINKNISQSLGTEDCEKLLATLQSQPSVVKLVDSFASKNSELSNKNRHYDRLRSSIEKKLQKLQSEYQQLEAQSATMEQTKAGLSERKQVITKETATLQKEIKRLSTEKLNLNSKVQTLTTQNDELFEANAQLKKDNKELKNIVDQIRLRLARDTKMLLQYEDSEIRKALIRLFRWTLG